ncbi:MAG: patatin-like phospholipase family protein [Myxococcota bacterium]
MAGRALVLGGGGVVGIAWEAGVVAGLARGGVDLRGADRVIGTSAGAIVGAWVAAGRDPVEAAAAELFGDGGPREQGPSGAKPDAEPLGRILRTWSAFQHLGAKEARVLGALALEAPAPEEERFVGWIAREIRTNRWPGSLSVTAVEVESGHSRVFDASSDAPLERAVAASCAVPGIFAPVAVDGSWYMDGGVRSLTNADLARADGPEAVLVIAPLPRGAPRLARLMARLLAEEVALLRARGNAVSVITPSAAEFRAFGPNLMDPAARATAVDAGRERGRREARSPALSAWQS